MCASFTFSSFERSYFNQCLSAQSMTHLLLCTYQVLNGAGATAARKIPKRASFIDVVRAAVAAGKAKQSRSNGVEISAQEKQKLNIGL
jgi:hypothetical protein